jgi:hypothetical protein
MVRHIRTRFFKCAFAAVWITTLSEAVRADSAVENASKWGLLGTWQLDCAAPVAGPNFAEIYVVRNGELFLDRPARPTNNPKLMFSGDTSAITSATVTDNGSLDLVVKFSKGSYEIVIGKVDSANGVGFRVVQNTNLDTNFVTVKDGVRMDGRPTPVMNRCR